METAATAADQRFQKVHLQMTVQEGIGLLILLRQNGKGIIQDPEAGRVPIDRVPHLHLPAVRTNVNVQEAVRRRIHRREAVRDHHRRLIALLHPVLVHILPVQDRARAVDQEAAAAVPEAAAEEEGNSIFI